MNDVTKIPIIVIVGPTASGKSDYAVKLAKEVNGEIISADSRQVYRGLDIGSGKITQDEMQGIKHYLLDVADPKDIFTANDFKKLGEQAIEEIHAKGKVPILVGGTGFYIQALVDDLSIPEVPPDNDLRDKLESQTTENLVDQLKRLDPNRYENIDRHNRARIIRSIEIATKIGTVPQLVSRSKYLPRFIGIDLPKDLLYKRIHDRLLKRIDAGMIDEVQGLHDRGLSWKRLYDLGLEYRYISQFLQDKMTEEEMLTKLETAIRQYAKRQLTWFRRDKRVEWVGM